MILPFISLVPLTNDTSHAMCLFLFILLVWWKASLETPIWPTFKITVPLDAIFTSLLFLILSLTYCYCLRSSCTSILLASSIVYADNKASSDYLSLRKCFLYFGSLTKENDWEDDLRKCQPWIIWRGRKTFVFVFIDQGTNGLGADHGNICFPSFFFIFPTEVCFRSSTLTWASYPIIFLVQSTQLIQNVSENVK